MPAASQAMKILINAMSYGIFIELNPEGNKRKQIIHALKSFESKARYEKPGVLLNPILAVMITAASRLFLAMAEAKVRELGGFHTYMDTDSIFVPPQYADDLVAFFEPLNPYAIDIQVLKKEKENLLFYGISSKRYALYHYVSGEITFVEEERSYKLHGLGHLTNPFSNEKINWTEKVWANVLQLHYGEITEVDLAEEYGDVYAISRQTVSNSHVWKKYEKLNKGKPWEEQIKPFNFFLVGTHVVKEDGRVVKPLAPYTKNPQKIAHEPFVDYGTGEIKQGLQYWKPLSLTIGQYIDHPEFKFEGDVGILERKHIYADRIITIGKEANNIDEQDLEVAKPQEYVDKEEIIEKILSLSYSQAERLGVDRKTFYDIKQRAKDPERFRLTTLAVTRLVSFLNGS